MYSTSDGWQETELEMFRSVGGGKVCLKWLRERRQLKGLFLKYTAFNDSCLMVGKTHFHLMKLCKEFSNVYHFNTVHRISFGHFFKKYVLLSETLSSFTKDDTAISQMCFKGIPLSPANETLLLVTFLAQKQ